MSGNWDAPPAQVRHDFADLAIAAMGGIAFALIALFLCVAPIQNNIAAGRDFVAFWATGQQLVHHANPYDAAAMQRIEHPPGSSLNDPVLFMRNLPWALPLAYPLGLIGLRVGALLWSLILLGCLAASVNMMRTLLGLQGNHIHWLGYAFAPALLSLIMGQTSLFALLGLVLFLRLHRDQPFLAGVSLWLCALKPQLFLPFGIVLLAWILISRNYKILAGAALSLAASCAVTWYIYPAAWTSYAQMMRQSTVGTEFIPCLSDALRLWLHPQSTWLQYLPAALCSVWGLVYYWQRRHTWDWLKHGSLLMVVSILAAPYCWIYDQALVIPALLVGASRIDSRRSLLAILALASLPIEVELVAGIRVTSPYFLWTGPAWLIWYLFASASEHKTGHQAEITEPALTSG